MTLSDQARREVLRQIDRDLDTRHGLDRLTVTDQPVYEPSPFWLAMEGHTECPHCHGPLTQARDCRRGCLDDLQDELLGIGDGPQRAIGQRDHRGWIRK